MEERDSVAVNPGTLEPHDVLRRVRDPQAEAWLNGLVGQERDGVSRLLRRALVDSELSGTYTPPDLIRVYERLNGSDEDLDQAVISEAALRGETQQLSPAGLAVVWSRLLRVQDNLSEGEVRSWLHNDMIRGLACKSATWSRFAAIMLGDWSRKPSATATENSLAGYLITSHPTDAAPVLTQAMREDPAGAARLADRIEAGSHKTLVSLAAAVVDDASFPAGLRIVLAGRADEQVRARARDMIVRELGVTDAVLAQIGPSEEPTKVASTAQDGVPTPAAQRLAWIVAGVSFLFGSLLGLGLQAAFLLAAAMIGVGWLVGRGDSE